MSWPDLALRGDGQQQLITLAGDEVDLDLDLFLVGPLVDELAERIVGARHPMVPETDIEFAGGKGAAHKRRGQRDGGCGTENASSGYGRCHRILPVSARPRFAVSGATG